MALTAESIVAAAQRLLTEYGLQDVTMRRLASELAVRPGALYYHVPSKQELLTRVARRILEPLAAHPGPPEVLMSEFREAVLPLHDGGDLMLIAYALDPEIPPTSALRGALQREGQSEVSAAELTSVLMRYALGSIAVEQNVVLLGNGLLGRDGAEAYQTGLRRLLTH